MIRFAACIGIIYLISRVYADNLEQVTFYHYPSKDSLQSYQQINMSNLNSLRLKKSGALYIVIHGFASNFKDSMPQTVKDAMLKSRPNGSVIVVDWSKLSGFEEIKINENMNFGQLMKVFNNARSKVVLVGREIAKLLEHLTEQHITNYSRVHLIGFSLGAHVSICLKQVAGVAGHTIIKNHNEMITRITGLDPAGPGFPMQNRSSRLDKSDAEFVDVYFSNRYFAGDIERNVGHADVYINGGRKQPGCTSQSLVNSTLCNHSFSWITWNYCMMKTCKACRCSTLECQGSTGICSDGIKVGMGVSLDITGDYYLKVEPLSLSA